MKKILLAYVPVLHQGYIDFFDRHRDAFGLLVIGDELLSEFDYLKKDVRALRPGDAVALLQRFLSYSRPGFQLLVAKEVSLQNLNDGAKIVVMPDEELSRYLHEKYFPRAEVQYDSVFLRWEQGSILKEREIQYERTVPFESLAEEMLKRAFLESHKATNLWRWVGAVIARDGEVILTGYNRQVPSPYTPYYEGDARMFFKKGLNVELTTDHHAEARLIAEAARKGITLEGSDLYITAFPCPPCAKDVAYSGIRRVYFASGYSLLDGERILKDNKVEIIHVKVPENIS